MWMTRNYLLLRGSLEEGLLESYLSILLLFLLILKQHSFNIDSVNLISTPKRWTLNLCRAFTIQESVS